MSPQDGQGMTSQRPYLIRAIWDWISDNGMTPYLLVDATRPGVQVPPQTVQDGKVVLNLSDQAVGQLELGDEYIRFHARFSGVSRPVVVPVGAALAIYARENGQGMAMPVEDLVPSADSSDADVATPASDANASEPQTASMRPVLVETHDRDDAEPRVPPGDDEPPPRKGGHLRIVK